MSLILDEEVMIDYNGKKFVGTLTHYGTNLCTVMFTDEVAKGMCSWSIKDSSQSNLNGYKDKYQRAWNITNSELKTTRLSASVSTIKSTTKEGAKTMKTSEIKLENDLTKSLGANIEVKEALASIEVIEGDMITALNDKKVAEKNLKDANEKAKKLEAEYQVQAKIVKSFTK